MTALVERIIDTITIHLKELTILVATWTFSFIPTPSIVHLVFRAITDPDTLELIKSYVVILSTIITTTILYLNSRKKYKSSKEPRPKK